MSTLILVLVGEVEMEELASLCRLVLGEVGESRSPLSLSFFPNTRPRKPPPVEDLLSLVPASLTGVKEVLNRVQAQGFER